MTQVGLWWSAGAAVLIAACAGMAEWRHSGRRDLDKVGLVPWGPISLLAFLAAIVALALAVKA